MNQVIVITEGNVRTFTNVTKIRFVANENNPQLIIYRGKRENRFNMNCVDGFECKNGSFYLDLESQLY